jgi:hypothetical protein
MIPVLIVQGGRAVVGDDHSVRAEVELSHPADRNLRLIGQARERRGEQVPWPASIEQALAQKARR